MSDTQKPEQLSLPLGVVNSTLGNNEAAAGRILCTGKQVPTAHPTTSELQRPDDWKEVSLSSVADVRFSSVDKLTYPSEDPVRLCNYIDVYENDYITDDLEFMQASATPPEISRFGLQVGDVIITKDSETPDDIGISTVVDYAAPDLVCGYHLGLIRPKQDKVDPTFLSKQLSHHRVARYFGRQANGLTRYGLPIGAVTNAPLWLPELHEQRAIGAVLRQVDEAIAKTEAVIAKLKQVRAGLLHDLLTRGIDEHGQLRDPVAHPEQFQDSPLGRIPRDWTVSTVGQLELRIIDGDRGSHYPNESQLLEQGFCVFLNNKNIVDGSIDFSAAQFISEERDSLLGKGKLNLGDIVITTRGTVGNIAVFNDMHPYPHVRINSGMIILRAYQNAFVSRFFVALWKFIFPSEYRRLSSGSAQPQFPIRDMQQFRLLVPKRLEQERIVSALSSVESALAQERRSLDKLARLKSGLMTDLLTGRVRVPEGIVVAS